MFSTPDLCDAHPEKVRVCELQFRQFGARRQFSGEIITIKCFEDNSLVKEVLATNGAGRILVVDGGGSLRRALLGDQIGESAVKNNWAGLVFFGAVRDVEELAALDLGILALGSTPLKTDKRGEGQRDLVLKFGGVDFHRGDFLYADNNGVVVSQVNLLK